MDSWLSLSIAIAALAGVLLVTTVVGISVVSLIVREVSLRQYVLAPFIGIATLALIGVLSTSFGINSFYSIVSISTALFLFAAIFRFKELRELRKRSFAHLKSQMVSSFLLILLPILAGVFALFTQFDGSEGFTYFARTGPDGLGYAISSQASYFGFSPSVLASQASGELGNLPIGNIISSLTSGIYDLPSFTLQVQNEFLVGAQRLGFASIAGALIKVLGMPNLWLVQTVIAATSYAITVVLAIYAFSRLVISRFRLALFTIFLILSPALLYSWFEGGIGQVFSMPAFVALFIGVFYVENKKLKIAIVCASNSMLIGSYIDGFFLSVLFLGALICLDLIQVMTRIRDKAIVFLGLGLGVLVTLPISLSIPQSIAARVTDSGQAGWQIPSNLGFLQLFGLKNFYSPETETSQLLWRDSQTSQTLVVLLVPLALIICGVVLGHLLTKKRLSWESATILVLFAAISSQFVLTQVLGKYPNYQLLKISAMVLPLLILMIVSIQVQTPSQRIGRIRITKRVLQTFAIALPALAVIVLISNSISFFKKTSEHTFPIDSQLVKVAYTPEVNDLFDQYMFVTTESSPKVVEDYFLGTLGDFYWLNRGPGVLKINPNQRSLALLGNGPQTKTTDSEFPFSLVSEPSQATTQKYVIDLHENPAIMSSHTPDDACLIAGILYSALHEVALNRCDPEKANLSGGVFTNQGITAELGTNSLLSTDDAEIRFISTVSPQLEDSTLLRINGELGSGEISLTPEGKLFYRDISRDSFSLIGWASTNSSTFARLIWSPDKLTAIVNNHPVGIEISNLGQIISVSAPNPYSQQGKLAGTVLPVTH